MELGYQQKQVLFGSLLGDGGLYKKYSYGNPHYSEQHCIRQSDYCKWKAMILREQFGVKEAIYNADRGTRKTYNITIGCNAFFKEIHEAFYRLLRKAYIKHYASKRINKDGTHQFQYIEKGYYKKVLPLSILHEIDELGLAVWFMDDGSSYKRHSIYCMIATDNFTLEENQAIVQWFHNRWDIECKIESVLRWNGKTYHHVIFNSVNSRKLVDLITPYVVECMKYKVTNNA